MEETLRALILTYKTAPVAVREEVSLNEEGVKRFLQYSKQFTGVSEAMVISTCNRTEIYYRSAKDASIELLKGLQIVKGSTSSFEGYFQQLEHDDAIEHLFEVSVGLDAQVIGDLQISGQVKNAYQWSADEGTAGPYLHRLMHTVFFANKRVVQETAFRDGAASISYAAKELVEDLVAGNSRPRIVIVGVGEIGRDVARNLADSGYKNVVILNRTLSKAEALATETGASFGGLDTLKEELKTADVVISSVSGESSLISKKTLAEISIHTHKYFIDLSMPRSIAADLEDLAGIVVYNLDDLQSKTNEALHRRKSSIPDVRAILKESIVDFKNWSREMVVSPTIQKIKNTLEQIRKEELARFVKNANSQEAFKLDEMSKSLMQKILKYPVLQLKAACRRGDAETLSELLLDLFDMERTNEKKTDS